MKFFNCILIQIIFLIVLLQSNEAGDHSKLLSFIKNPKSISGDLRNFLENIRNRMCYPIKKLNLTRPLDTFTYEDLKYDLKTDFANLFLHAKSIRGIGLSDFVVKTLQIQLSLSPKLIIDIYIPKQIFDIKYKLNGSIGGLFHLDGEGDINFVAENVGFHFEAKITILKLKINITELVPYIGNFNVRIDNLFPDEELNEFINQMIKDLAPEMVNDMWKKQEKQLITTIEEEANKILKNYTLLTLKRKIENLKYFFDENDPEPNCKSKNALKI